MKNSKTGFTILLLMVSFSIYAQETRTQTSQSSALQLEIVSSRQDTTSAFIYQEIFVLPSNPVTPADTIPDRILVIDHDLTSEIIDLTLIVGKQENIIDPSKVGKTEGFWISPEGNWLIRTGKATEEKEIFLIGKTKNQRLQSFQNAHNKELLKDKDKVSPENEKRYDKKIRKR